LSALLHATEGSKVADAAMGGDRAAVRALVTGGEDVNAAQGDGMTALHWAARHGDVDLIKMLLAAGANVKATTRLANYTPLLMAAELGSAGAIDALIAAGADPKGTTESGVSPLMLASAAGHADAVRTLISRGADVDAAEPKRGTTALMFAAANRRTDAIRALLAAGAKVEAASKVVSLKATAPTAEEEAFLAAQAGGGRRGATPAATATPAPAAPSAATPSAATPSAATTPTFTAAAPARQNGITPPNFAVVGQPAAPPAETSGRQGGGGTGRGGGRGGATAGIAGLTRQFTYAELASAQGGLTPLLFSVRQGHLEAAALLLDAGAGVNVPSGSDKTTPLLMAVINGHFDLAGYLLDRGANPNLASENGVTPLYAALNVQWAPRALYPQPRAYLQQKLTYLDMMKVLIAKGADVNARLNKKVWYSEYNFPLSGVDEIGATPFWRAAYASDVDAMKLLAAHGADPNIPTMKPAGRPRTGDAAGRETIDDVSGLPPLPTGGPGVPPIVAAAGTGFGEGFAGNSHRNAPSGFLAAVQYLVEEMHADVNSRDHEGNTPLHNAAARGDNATIEYLVSKGADVKAVNRAGETTADMANSPVSRIEPFPDTIALLVKLGAKNNGKCKACS
jgi:ankyrin repeat protein